MQISQEAASASRGQDAQPGHCCSGHGTRQRCSCCLQLPLGYVSIQLSMTRRASGRDKYVPWNS